MNNSIPVGLQSLLAKLNFLSQITRGHKPCMSDMTLVEATSWTGSFHRMWTGESRKTVIAEIEKIISETIEAIGIHSDTEFLQLIVNSLSETRIGIETLKITYRGDPEMLSRIKVQLTNIDLQLDVFRDLIKGYKRRGKSDERKSEERDSQEFKGDRNNDNSNEDRSTSSANIADRISANDNLPKGSNSVFSNSISTGESRSLRRKKNRMKRSTDENVDF